jgi:hypothetical protein
MKFLKNNNFENILIKIIIIAGFILSGYQFFYNRSLWFDEAADANNIINRTHLALLKPLDFKVIAPILFIQIEKIFSELIPDTELGLRLFPLLCFFVSVLLFVRIVKIIHSNYFTIILSILLFIFNLNLIYYSSELKQYMSDVLILTAIYYLILREYKDEKLKYYYLGIAGAVSIFLSNIAPIILFTVFIYLLYNYFKNKNNKYFFLSLSISALWGILFLVYFYSFIYNNPVRGELVESWSNSFLPLNPFSVEFYRFILDKGKMIGSNFFQLRSNIGVIVLYLFIIIGYVFMFRKKRYDLMIITVIPILLHLLSSGLKLYPFGARLLLYNFPLIIIICSFGFDLLYVQFFSKFKIEHIRIILISIALLKFGFLTSGLPIQHQEVKKSLEYMESKYIKGDKLYLYSNAKQAYNYYQKIHKTNNSQIVIKGRYIFSEEDMQKKGMSNCAKYFIDDFKNFNGRYWLLFTYFNKDIHPYIIKALDSLGYRRLDEYKAYHSSIYLYDFNRQWQYSNGPYGGMRITCLETRGSNIFAGTKEGGIFLSTDNGGSWTSRNNGITNTHVTSIAINGANVLAGTAGGGVFLSRNNGASWTAKNNGLNSQNIHSIIIKGSNIFAGTDRGIYLSTNEGESWTARNNGLNKTDVYALTSGGSNIFAGTAGAGEGRGGIFLSTDNGLSWKPVNSGLNKSNVYSLVISRGNIFAGTDGGVFLSTNNGATWIAKNYGMINVNVHSIIVNGENIFVGTDGGVFLSTNNGRKWNAMNEGLKDCQINSLAISRTNIFAGTLNSGVWKRIDIF